MGPYNAPYRQTDNITGKGNKELARRRQTALNMRVPEKARR